MNNKIQYLHLPKGWIWTTIGEIAILSSGGTPDREIQGYFNGNIPWVKSGELNYNVITNTDEKITDIAIENSSAKVVPSGTLLVALYGNTVGKLAFLGVDAATNQAVASIITTSSFEQKYLYYYLLNNREKLLQKRIGAAQPNISQKILENFPIPLSSLEEQRAIISSIDSLFSKLKEAESLLRNSEMKLKVYKQALLKKAFDGELTKNWRQDKALDAYKELINIQKERGELNNSKIKKEDKKHRADYNFVFKRDVNISMWAESTLDNLIDINARIGWRGLTKKEYTSTGAILLSVHSLNYGKNVVFKDVNYVSIERYEESPEIQLKVNDILLCKDGSGIGKVGIIKKLPNIATVNSSLLVINGREVFNPDFLYYFFLGPDMQRLVNGKISGSAIPHLFQKDIKQFKLKVPPILEQNEIVEILESRFSLADNIEKVVNSTLDKITVLKHSILKKAFEGELVKNSTTEPAVNLLEQIKIEKIEYLKSQKELVRNKPKQKKQMEEKKSVLEVLKEYSTPITVQQLWESSNSDGDIEMFYSQIKDIYDQIIEVKSETESLLSLKK